MNVIEYVIQNRNKTFSEMPFSEIDALVFAQLAYYNFSLIEDKTYIKEINQNLNPKIFTETRNLYEIDGSLFSNVCASKRYADVLIENYVNDFDPEYQKQFCAIRFWIDKHTCVVSFRGTDGTIVGWKENFNMTYMSAIPSQIEAGFYLNETCSLHSAKRIYVVGHSKGGNLAIYAASKVKEQYLDKIIKVYNFDGPGFKEIFYQTQGFKNIRDKIEKYIPPQSCVGRILHDDQFKVVKSEDKFVWQHWIYNWVIEDNHFCIEPNAEEISDDIDITLDEILNELSIPQRQYVVDTFYKLFQMHDTMYVDDIFTNKQESLKLVKNFLKVDKENKGQLSNVMWRILLLFLKNYSSDKKEEIVNKFNAQKNKTTSDLKAEVTAIMNALKKKLNKN